MTMSKMLRVLQIIQSSDSGISWYQISLYTIGPPRETVQKNIHLEVGVGFHYRKNVIDDE